MGFVPEQLLTELALVIHITQVVAGQDQEIDLAKGFRECMRLNRLLGIERALGPTAAFGPVEVVKEGGKAVGDR